MSQITKEIALLAIVLIWDSYIHLIQPFWIEQSQKHLKHTICVVFFWPS